VEEKMLKPLIAAAAVFAIVGSSVVNAQGNFGGQGGSGHWGPRAEHRHRPSAADMAAFTDARIAALKAGLELTPDQQKDWPAFEQALRDVAQLRIARMQARQARMQQGQTQPQGQGPNGPFDRLAHRADNLAKTSAALKKLADAGAPLYQSLNDDQKQRFVTLSRMLRPHPHRMAFNERGGRWGQDGRGMGSGGQGFGPGHHRFGSDNGGNDGGSGSQL
jgi:zinc resistance-associated protein